MDVRARATTDRPGREVSVFLHTSFLQSSFFSLIVGGFDSIYKPAMHLQITYLIFALNKQKKY